MRRILHLPYTSWSLRAAVLDSLPRQPFQLWWYSLILLPYACKISIKGANTWCDFNIVLKAFSEMRSEPQVNSDGMRLVSFRNFRFLIVGLTEHRLTRIHSSRRFSESEWEGVRNSTSRVNDSISISLEVEHRVFRCCQLIGFRSLPAGWIWTFFHIVFHE